MNAMSGTFEATETQSALTISETIWGYIVAETGDRFDRESLGEAGLRFLGIVLVLLAYGQWLLPASVLGANAFAMKAAMTFFFGAAGGVIYWAASRGMQTEIHFNTERRDVRTVARNAKGHVRILSRWKFDAIESVFTMRPPEPGAPVEFYLRLRGKSEPFLLFKGGEEEVRALHQRLIHDMAPAQERLQARLARELDIPIGVGIA